MENQKRKVNDFILLPEDLIEAQINTAQSCLIKANTSLNQEEKIKSLIIAEKIICGALKSLGVDYGGQESNPSKK